MQHNVMVWGKTITNLTTAALDRHAFAAKRAFKILRQCIAICKKFGCQLRNFFI